MILFYVGLVGLGKKKAEYIDTFRINPIGSIKKQINSIFKFHLESAKIKNKVTITDKVYWDILYLCRKNITVMMRYITDEGIIIDYCDFVQFLEFKMKFDSWDNVECFRLYLNSFDEFPIDFESWNAQKQLLVEKFIYI